MNDKSNNIIKNLIPYIVVIIVGIIYYNVLAAYDWQPSGSDVWGHMYKAQFMYENLKKGIFYPLIDYKWYNSIQLYRYWPPLSYYIMAGMMFLTDGALVESYRLVLLFAYLLAAFCWATWGNVSERRVLGTLFGVIWVLMPEIIRIYMCDGNLPQIITTPIAAWIVFFLWLYIRKNNNAAGLGLYAGMVFMTFGHLMITALMGASAFVYLVFDYFENKDLKRKITALCIMVSGIMSAGIWLVPSLIGGGIGDDQSTIYVAPFNISLNPLYRLLNERIQFYFGLSVILVCIAGVMLAYGHKRAGFKTTLLIFFFTSPTTYALIELLPVGEMFWMSRFSPMLYAFFFASLLDWRALKKRYCILFMALILLDISPVLEINEYAVLADAGTEYDVQVLRDNTTQRAAVLDQSEYGSYPSYGVSGDDGVSYTFGWAWQGAATADNIVMLNSALENGDYAYMFDRCIELGDDAVLVQKTQVEKAGMTEDSLINEAAANGYYLAQETDSGYIFKKNTPEQFGVITTYSAIAIGKYALSMATYYPAFTSGDTYVVDEYTFDELKDYKTIFLTGFEYNDRKAAEELLKELAAYGVNVVVDTTHMPSDKSTKQETFLNVTSQQVKFAERYTELSYKGAILDTQDFNEEDSDFSTGYIAHLDNVDGTFSYGDKELIFAGYNDDNPNIYFIGLNLMYYACETRNKAITSLLNSILMISTEETPVRRLVEISVYTYSDMIVVVSPEDNVNTTIAYQDIFSSDSTIKNVNNLLVVNKGMTTIKLEYPYLLYGCILSVLGILAGIGIAVYHFVENDKQP